MSKRIIWVIEQLINEDFLKWNDKTNAEIKVNIENNKDCTEEQRARALEVINDMIKKSHEVYKLGNWNWIEGKDNYSYMKEREKIWNENHKSRITRIVKATIPIEQKYISSNYEIIEFL